MRIFLMFFLLFPLCQNALAIDCPPGTFADTTGNKECKKCPANTFSSTQGAKSCDVCPSGTYSDEGATECTPVNNPASIYQCGAGTQPKNGTDTPTSASDCEDCPAGTYKSLTGNTSCTPCESGKYVSGTGNTECQPCPPDTYFSGTGATGRNKCQSCPNGKHSPSGSTSINSCVSDPTPPVNTCNCPDNQACKSATDTTCIPCGETPQSGITAQGICKMCNLGYIFDGTKCTQARIISPEQMKKCMGKIDPDEFKRCALGDY